MERLLQNVENNNNLLIQIRSLKDQDSIYTLQRKGNCKFQEFLF
ncbi:unnamed protein product [Paramecium pentaurelia]|uniref:Uncharacterized protein n=1 Tax=Paramecium pentaurelia TaxID=43138 RepID=A0A8S1VFN6_9CILI|nr:unnamed protein product [Paramecium pentaurelia]